MCILIVESIANKPHLEISGEIALKNKKRNLNIDYAWVGNDLKWTEWQEPRIFSFLGIKIQNRVKNFLTLLSKKKINILNEQIINEETLHKIDRWSKKFNGNLNYKEIIKSSAFCSDKDQLIKENQILNKNQIIGIIPPIGGG